MTKEEYDSALLKEKDIYDRAVRMIRQRYALANNPYQIGMIVSDHSDTIKIESISPVVGFGDKYPSCTYFGPKLRKDGTPFKSGEKTTVYQCNIKQKP